MSALFITILVGVIAAAIGLAVGWQLGAQKSDDAQAIQELEERLQIAESKRAEYEAEVSEHFAKTAALVSKMTEDYKSLYGHLAEGAGRLCDENVQMPALAAADSTDDLPSVSFDTQPPRDYAPKTGDGPGQLSEDFGLEKTPEPSPFNDRIAS